MLTTQLTDKFIGHVIQGHDCVLSETNVSEAIPVLKQRATSHGYVYVEGPCIDHGKFIKSYSDMGVTWKVYQAAPVTTTWGGADVMHTTHGKRCIQFKGDAIKDASTDKTLAAYLAEHGAKAVNGSCNSANFHNLDHTFPAKNGYQVSIWV